MKNYLKLAFLATSITISITACSGHESGSHPDTTKADAATASDSTRGGVAPGTNGVPPAAVDSGMDESGSGGTDTVQKSKPLK